MINVGNRNLPEEIILSIESCEDGNFTVSYDYDGETRKETTFNPFDREDVSSLLKRRPELLKTKEQGKLSLEQLEEATSEVFQSHDVPFSLKFDSDLKSWVFAAVDKWVTVDADKAIAIKKALQRSGYLQEVAAKLQ